MSAILELAKKAGADTFVKAKGLPETIEFADVEQLEYFADLVILNELGDRNQSLKCLDKTVEEFIEYLDVIDRFNKLPWYKQIFVRALYLGRFK